MVFKMDVKPNFAVENEAAISTVPKVDFNKAPAPAPAAKADAGAGSKAAAVPDAAAELLKKGY
jgi:hypothetical protein